MINMKLLEVVTIPSIHHGCSTWKTFWYEKFIDEKNFAFGEFKAVNMKNCGRHIVRKHREINGSYKYVTLDILLKLDSLDKMKITSSYSKVNLRISGKGLITTLCLNAKTRPKT